MDGSIYDHGLDRNAANYAPLTPITFAERAASVFPDKVAVIHGEQRYTYAEFWRRCQLLAGALRARGIGLGDTVSVLAPNVPAMLEAHFGIGMAGAVLNPLNYRLDPASIAFILEHGESRLLIVDPEFSATAREALSRMTTPPPVIDIDDPQFDGGEAIGEMGYEAFLATGQGQVDAGTAWDWPADEWQAIGLNYTSGTTGNPKGVVYHHRGAFLNAIGNVTSFGLNAQSVYLWTLPMFHCNGWCYTWAVTALAGTHVCLRTIDPALIFPLIRDHQVTHMCGAPIILTMLIHAPEEAMVPFEQTVEVATGGAAPPSAVIAAMERMGFRVTHLYGLTECYGPATLCEWQEDWGALELDGKAAMMARQGVAHHTVQGVRVADQQSGQDVPRDGQTIGEILLRSNTVMKGYLKNPKATAEAFQDGWFHTGDLAVMHPDGYVEVKDRSKDIIISGGENISSLEIEETLYKHPKIMEAAVVARPDPKWGESPCAFVTPKPGEDLSEPDVIGFCRENMAHFKVPKTVVFGPLPKTSTGKIQKFTLRDRAREL